MRLAGIKSRLARRDRLSVTRGWRSRPGDRLVTHAEVIGEMTTTFTVA